MFYIEIIRHFKKRTLRFYEYGYLAISVQKFHKTLALKKCQKPKPDQYETLSASSYASYFGQIVRIHLFEFQDSPHFVNETKGVMHVIRFDLRFLIGYCIAAK